LNALDHWDDALGLSYSFGGKEVKQARRRSTGIEEEKGRIGGVR